ncbi:MAG TPA: hypothetical protein VGO40_03405 [Longimicrobium sp.]|jgi:hypothetical protein|nr:hypothetical protein [Longimicrobium sp.]
MTMECAAARALLLEADPAELRGEVDSPLAAHLRACADCRSQADAILAGEADLDDAVRAMAQPSVGTRVIPLRPTRWGRRMVPAATTFAALAAAVAGVMLARPHPAQPRGATTEQIARLMFPAPPVARAAAGQSVAVLKTSDPGVTVVWVY